MTAARTLTDLAALLDTAQVASILRMTPTGVRTLISRGLLAPCGRGGRGVALFRPSDVQAFIEGRCANGGAQGSRPARRPHGREAARATRGQPGDGATRPVWGDVMDIRITIAEGARMPTRAHPGDAGLDLSALETVYWLSYECVTRVRTGVCIEIPSGYMGLLLGRSSTTDRGFEVVPAVIDSGYRGEVRIQVRPFSGSPSIEAGDRIAQLVIAPVWTGTLVVVDALSESERGSRGYGSSGVR